MAKFKFAVSVDPSTDVVTARVGSAADLAGRLIDDDKGKLVKLAGDSQYDLCAVGDPVSGQFVALEPATQDGWAIGSVQKDGRIAAVCDGLEASPGTGVIAVGDYVVCGSVDAAGTALTTSGPKVVKATVQPGEAIVSALAASDTAADTKVVLDAALTLAADQQANALAPWRVVSLGNAGAVGDTCIIERA